MAGHDILRVLDVHSLVLLFLVSVSYDHSALLDFLMSEETPFLDFLVEYLRLVSEDWESLCEACARGTAEDDVISSSSDSQGSISDIQGRALDQDVADSISDIQGRALDQDVADSISDIQGRALDQDVADSISDIQGALDQDVADSISDIQGRALDQDVVESSNAEHCEDEVSLESHLEACFSDEDTPPNQVKRIKLSVIQNWSPGHSFPQGVPVGSKALDSVIAVFIRLKYALLRLHSKRLIPPALCRLIPLLECVEDIYEAT